MTMENESERTKDHELVRERLQELEGWAEYVFEALHWDQRSEPVKRAMLERVVELQALREIRELSWMLRDKIHKITTELEYSHETNLSIVRGK